MTGMAQKFLAPFKNIHGFKKGHEPKKGRLASDLFQYVKCGDIGFPERPTSLAYDSTLDLVAVGTADGVIKVLGKPDVEFTSVNPAHSGIQHMSFIPYQGRIVTLCGNNQLLLWELKLDDKGVGTLELTKTLQLPNEREQDVATCMCVDEHRKVIFVGLMSGNISVVHLNDGFVLAADEAITVNRVTSGLPAAVHGELHFGAVAGLALSPRAPHTRLLIGYSLGAAVLWRVDRQRVERVMPRPQQALESVTWQADNRHMMASYADGSYLQWQVDAEDEEVEEEMDILLKSADPPNQPYGPFPCKAITRLLWRPSPTTDANPFLIFAGGMPRASFGDRHTVSVLREPDQVCFDFTSPVVDFLTVDEPGGAAHTLLVLLEEELVSVDLRTEEWPLIQAPYLCALHSSAITTVRLCDNVPPQLLQYLDDLGRRQRQNPFSPRSWPVQGGRRVSDSSPEARHLLLTGHEDGSVSMWALGGDGGTRRLYTLHTSAVYVGDFPAHEPGQHEQEETWPPFRRTGDFDPYSDDPRLAVKQLELYVAPGENASSGSVPRAVLAVGGAAGQVSVWQLGGAAAEVEVDVSKVIIDILPKSDQAHPDWRTGEPLAVKEGGVAFAEGFQPTAVAQLQPASAVTAMALSPGLGLLAAGCALGLGVVDFRACRAVYSYCTLPAGALSGGQAPQTGTLRGGTMASRGFTLKKSLRNSFRRLRKFRSSRRAGKSVPPNGTVESGPHSPSESPTEANARTALQDVASAASTTGATVDANEDGDRERVSVERSVEARPGLDNSNAAIVRCLLFAETAVVAGGPTPCLLSGSNAGTALLHVVRVSRQGEPGSGDSGPGAVSVELRKELQLQHRAPILHLAVVDARAPHLPAQPTAAGAGAPGEPAEGHAPEHDLLVVSEEQAKLFSLPQLRPRHKAKLTALDGNRLKRAAVQRFPMGSGAAGEEAVAALSVVNGAGQCLVLSLPQLRRQAVGEAIPAMDMVGLSSARLLQPCPLGLYQSAPGQVSLFSMAAHSAADLGRAAAVELPAGARPPETTSAGRREDEGERGNATETAPANNTGGGPGQASDATTPEADQEAAAEAEATAEGTTDAAESAERPGATASGDISLLLGGDVTIDSIKEYVAKHPIFDLESYIRGEGEPVVKRTELVLERQTLIAGGHVTTRTTEKEVVDGRTVREETTTSSVPAPNAAAASNAVSQVNAGGGGD